MLANIKSRILATFLALVCVFTVIPVTNVHAEENVNGYAMSGAHQKVYEDAACTDHRGAWLNDYEGFTVLSKSGSVYKISYSTSVDAAGRIGYVRNLNFRLTYFTTTCSGTIKSSTNLYGGPQIASSLKTGSISAGEIVAVIYSENGWSYIEYNTSSGRKRGYIQSAYVNSSFSGVQNFPQSRGAIRSETVSAQSVYGGPSEEYATIGSLSSNELVTIYDKVDNGMDTWYYIGYHVSGGLTKFGYILIHS